MRALQRPGDLHRVGRRVRVTDENRTGVVTGVVDCWTYRVLYDDGREAITDARRLEPTVRAKQRGPRPMDVSYHGTVQQLRMEATA